MVENEGKFRSLPHARHVSYEGWRDPNDPRALQPQMRCDVCGQRVDGFLSAEQIAGINQEIAPSEASSQS